MFGFIDPKAVDEFARIPPYLTPLIRIWLHRVKHCVVTPAWHLPRVAPAHGG